jgi:dTDP-4-amino-4,6-dideoxygalactose transaminase
MITKGAGNPARYARRMIPFDAARSAFEAILKALAISSGKVLLPAFIGWSAREGSGVFDPIASLQLDYGFYALDDTLRIDLNSLRSQLQRGDVRVLVIIHYFGYVDPAYAEAVKIAREHGVFVLEDEAHAMLSDLIGGSCGRLGDACIYSFHKMLPVRAGGAVVVNDAESFLARELSASPGCPMPLYDFDLLRIAGKRRANALLLDRLVQDLAPWVEPLFGAPDSGEVPQSYPIMIRSVSRDVLYQEMNSAGFGVVSLYHTMISQIPPDSFPAATRVARRIMNLPVHQDASEESLEAMVRELSDRVREK